MFKLNKKILIITFATIISIIAFINIVFFDEKNAPYVPDNNNNSNVSSDTAVKFRQDVSIGQAVDTKIAPTVPFRIIKSYDGRLAVFISAEDKMPSLQTDISIYTLSESEREMFAIGVAVYSQEELTRLLEDFGS